MEGRICHFALDAALSMGWEAEKCHLNFPFPRKSYRRRKGQKPLTFSQGSCPVRDLRISELSIRSDKFLDMFRDCHTALSKKLTKQGPQGHRRWLVRVVRPACNN